MNKKKIFNQLVLLFLTTSLFSQVHTNIVQQKTYGGNQDDEFAVAIQTIDGGYLVGGSSKSGISGDKTDSSRGWSDVWLLKLNSNLTLQWQKTIGGSEGDDLRDMIAVNNNSYLLLIQTSSPVSGEKTVDNYGLGDYWLVKIDSIGNILWQKTYGGDNANYPANILEIDNNNYVLLGTSNSDSSGVKTENSRGGYDFWFLIVDSLGNIIYDKTIGGNSSDFCMSGYYNSQADEIYLAGRTTSSISGDITNEPYSILEDYLLFKINATFGQIISNFRYGGSKWNGLNALGELNGNIYLGGSSTSDSSGVKTENNRDTTNYWSDYWILKLNPDGSIVWDKTIGGNYRDYLMNMVFANNNQLLLIGSSSSDITGEKEEARIGQDDYWIVSIDTNSNILWQKTIGGNYVDNLKQAIVLGPNHYILFGDSKSDVSGNKNEYCRGGLDYWIVEISTNLSIEDFSPQRLAIFPNPAKESFKIQLPENVNSGLLYIFDTKGSIIFAKNINEATSLINISHLSKGNYFVTFYDAQGNGYATQLVK